VTGERGDRTTIYVTTFGKEIRKISPEKMRAAGALIATTARRPLSPTQRSLVDLDWFNLARELAIRLGTWPSSGIVALSAAIRGRPKLVRLVGMDLGPRFERPLEWDRRYTPPWLWHNWLGERRVLADLSLRAHRQATVLELPPSLRASIGAPSSRRPHAGRVRIAVIVPTRNRPELLRNRALRSAAAQTLTPDVLLVVDDSDRSFREGNQSIVEELRIPRCRVEYLKNERTPECLAGALNTALFWLARKHGDIVAAFLDDDDAWEPDYLESVRAAFRGGADLAVSGVIRHEPTGPRPANIPLALSTDDFLVGNPNVGGSNLAVRLDDLLQAGGFDENLNSSTDRSFLIRLFDMPGVRTEIIRRHLVHYDAQGERLSTPGPRKTEDARKFHRRHRHRLDEGQIERARARNLTLFGVDIEAPTVQTTGQTAPPMAPSPSPRGTRALTLDVGVIATPEPGPTPGFVRGLTGLARDPRLSRLRLVILVGPRVDGKLRAALTAAKGCGMQVIEASAADAPPGLARASIAANRAKLQEALLELPGPDPDFTWVADDDLRLDADIIDPVTGEPTRRTTDLVAALIELHRRGEGDVILGDYTGAPPVPAASTMRPQLVDVQETLSAYARLNPDDQVPRRLGSAFRAEILRTPEYYYSFASHGHRHLETPVFFEPPPGVVTPRQALRVLADRVGGLFDGVPVTRPALSPWLDVPRATETLVPSDRCGGTTFIRDRSLLRVRIDVPKFLGRDTRRGDMMWALRLKRGGIARVVRAHIPLRQERRSTGALRLDLTLMADDILGHAAAGALREVHRGRTVTRSIMRKAWLAFRRAAKRRLLEFEVDAQRVLGLARALERFFFLPQEDPARVYFWWLYDPASAESVRKLLEFVRALQREYRPEAIQRVRQTVLGAERACFEDWFGRVAKFPMTNGGAE